MKQSVIEFERPIAELESKLEELTELARRDKVDFSSEISNIKRKVKKMRRDIFLNLAPLQRAQLARHPMRPHTLDYIDHMTTDFLEMRGDRLFGNDKSIVGGFCNLESRTVMIIGQQKGRDTKENLARNFGMANPEGYRKAQRLMKLAEKFNRPIITLIDTKGAFPGKGAEERGQAEAIARSLLEMSRLTVPVVCVVIGEGGSGGALAIGVGNRVLMMEYSVYSVISPEGCAAILWKSADKAPEAAKALRMTAPDLLEFGIVDEVVKEPLGGAHKDFKAAASILRRALRRNLDELARMSPQELVRQRRKKFRKMGSFV
ncbi:MAG: acetyl-CoA carboxylase carboxyltransferase subunit alpha [Nitrospinota bacterium]|nr:acetyl-CoA carboxylase carboxyltransferase subunit alpha [Nitrospinota bacterium]MDH5755687.1 acetyl-CoA carboxylase carboxyltransferase subunit alpha [Nitrospinota bacterium]